MDFRRIEWIFLVVFVGLNIFLGISYFQVQQVDLATITDITRDQIKLPHLSKKTPQGDYLASQANTALSAARSLLVKQQVTISEGDYQELQASLDEPITLKKNQEQQQLATFVKNNVYHGKEYEYAPALSNDERIVFAQHPKAGLIYDRRAAVTLHVNDNRLVSYTQTYLSKLSVLRDRLNLMSEQDAVIALYRDNDIPNNSAIVSTKLAYSYLLDAKGSTVYVPAWYIGVKNRATGNVTVKRVNAITRTVMKNRSDN
ncbi:MULTISPECIES: two-component system regulatory protein YycI [Lacticaseibacillus]|uniref:Regulatory protein YycH-like domain-containing protein n=1 Tax=Lacticaseibacillus casei DSM 20011 = JCM 1134 = ATCC 393 TaxID=1423732 RepID=A0AAD1AS20_LACCA|nr:two-component system regulatory protein YycI [Lacticaseibacillus casei]HAJ53703.1 hypothetical protein [Lactobacillus sp.]MBI6597419.1 two-component system regulatory protein YycI [Lacticaseibacillus casei]MBO1481109.1 two-component system regulatory protein YycI [Lacticaseibacillus casei]MBO2416394.1 two-component system regulatory protein YycI [Lacticaseibacillus casei]MCK2080789.1 two-component system regulatory protein YycI [Lacticaseibacillus casei]